MFASHLGQTSFEVTLQASAVRHAGRHAGPPVDAAVLSHPISRSLGCLGIMLHFQMVAWQQNVRVAAPSAILPAQMHQQDAHGGATLPFRHHWLPTLDEVALACVMFFLFQLWDFGNV